MNFSEYFRFLASVFKSLKNLEHMEMRAQYKICFDRSPHLTNVPESLIIPPGLRHLYRLTDGHKIEISTIHRSRERLGRVDSGETTTCPE
jgi:hypothetical protein